MKLNKLKIILILIFLIICIFILSLFLPYKNLHNLQKGPWSTRIIDCDNNIIQILPLENPQGVRREYTPLKDIPQEIIDSFIQNEDQRFFTHKGIDILAIFRALKQNISEGKRISGASTITMQLARIVSPAPKRNLFYKIIESYNALRIETLLTKNEILELYLNTLPFGFLAEGITSASRVFFGKPQINPLKHLSQEQIQTLAKIPRRPKAFSELVKKTNYTYPYFMPHYVNFLCKEIKKQKISLPPQLKINSSLQIYLKAESLLVNYINEFSNARLTNGAILLIENSTGKVLTWVGSQNFFDTKSQGQIDGVLVTNQPGSSMKPFLYATALENGFSANSILPDIPSEFGFSETYIPRNFNNRYYGPVRFTTSLASSLNVTSVWLLNQISPQKYLSKLLDLRFDSLKKGLNNTKNPTSHSSGLSLALGGAEVSLYEIVKAFSVFANDGKLIDFYHCDLLKTEKPKEIFLPDTARIICSILSNNSERSLGFGYSENFSTPFSSIFKTGTANQFQNITALASTPLYTIGVWLGNFNGDTVIKKTGSSIPAKIAKEILIGTQGNIKINFKEPINYSKKQICSLSGKAASENCPQKIYEYILDQNTDFTKDKCNWHILEDDKVKTIYPGEFQRWFYEDQSNQSHRFGNINYDSTNLEIISPRQNSIFIFDPKTSKENQQLNIEVVGGTEDFATIYYDNFYIKNITRPFNFFIPLEVGSHKVSVECGAEKVDIEYLVK